ncbi:hypothetical protein [Yoonia sp. BS5-3]|uniref:Uncharacterized protein n=1 Tax=Yoonia phaeophyticola TaxID=3137369 RepID=A0ABZ2V005_9RHOB
MSIDRTDQIVLATAVEPGFFIVWDGEKIAEVALPDKRNQVGYSNVSKRMWCLSSSEICLYDSDSGRKLETTPFDSIAPFWERRIQATHTHLFAVRQISAHACEMLVISIENGEVLQRIEGLPNLCHPAVKNAPLAVPVTPSGNHLFAAIESDDTHRSSVLVSVDPTMGTFSVDRLDTKGLPEPEYMLGFSTPSPDGRYWLRAHGGPLQEKQPTRRQWLRRIPDGPKTYEFEIQLWQSEPLRFLRTLTVNRLRIDEITGLIGRISNVYREDANLIAYKAMIDMIVAKSQRYKDHFSSGMPVSDLQGTLDEADLSSRLEYDWSQLSDTVWDRSITRLMSTLLAVSSENRWTQDGRAIWISNALHFICVGVDGKTSYRFQRPRRSSDLKLFPGKDRQAELIGFNVAWPLDGNPVADGLDHQSLELTAVERQDERAAYREQLKKRRAHASRLRVDWGAQQKPEAALRNMAQAFRDGAMREAVETFDIDYRRNGKGVAAAKFWSDVQKEGATIVPALQDAIASFLDAAPRDRFYKSGNDDHGESTLDDAVVCLACLDVTAIDTLVLRYASHFDGSHHQSFFGKIMPNALKTHGWTKEMMRLGIWAVFVDRGIADEPETYWNEGGLKAALQDHYSEDETLRIAKELIHRDRWPSASDELIKKLRD